MLLLEMVRLSSFALTAILFISLKKYHHFDF